MHQPQRWPLLYLKSQRSSLASTNCLILRIHQLSTNRQHSERSFTKADASEVVVCPNMSSYYRFVRNPTAPLSSGHAMPLVGLGTWKSGKGEVHAAVKVALQAGYRHIDCAYVYQNEDEVHWPVTGNKGPHVEPPLHETWAAMEKLVDEGLVRSIGVSNCSAAKLHTLMETARIPPAVNQVELHPYLRQDGLLAFCKQHNIHVTAYSPLGSPDSADQPMLRRSPKLPAVMQDPMLQRIAEKLGKNVGQVLIRWAVQRGTSVIPKSAKPERIQGNLDVLDWELPEEDFQALSSFPEQIRFLSGIFWLNPEGPYRTLGELWDDPEEDMRYMQIVKKYGDGAAPAEK